ncbi:GFA family protein [Roseibium aggregatum]|uniref:GFA family protein n=1 Tax=Roseibium aggregatum TaxID=187304 RepID=A0A926S7N6_9HYPH|nr:GFA family protein [Roseibium aggregatum]MBD1548826.1 GFA family protein [Roseibium aggregatum]
MKLQGSCQCGAVSFSLESRTPYPYMRCYCSVCRKTDGGGGYAINLMGEAASLDVHDDTGAKRSFRAVIDGQESVAERHFCSRCGTSLWLWDPRWPELIHPLASAIDTPLPRPPETVHIMLEYKPSWVEVPEGPGHIHFQRYPELSIEDWHKSHGLFET